MGVGTVRSTAARTLLFPFSVLLSLPFVFYNWWYVVYLTSFNQPLAIVHFSRQSVYIYIIILFYDMGMLYYLYICLFFFFLDVLSSHQ